MMNLKNRSKRFYLKVFCHAVVISILIGASAYSISENLKELEEKDNLYNKYKQEQDSLIKDLERTLDSLRQVSFDFEEERLLLNQRIDSLHNVKNVIEDEYEQEITIIPDASMDDHNDWFQSKLAELKNGVR